MQLANFSEATAGLAFLERPPVGALAPLNATAYDYMALTPSYQQAWVMDDWTPTWTVTVAKLPNASRTLTFTLSNGASQVTVPAGTGTVSYNVAYTIRQGEQGTYVQHAELTDSRACLYGTAQADYI